MDLVQKGKQLAQDGHYEEALDAFLLALENDKENPDIHFYLGLCYSSLEEFRYAKHHYQMALTLQPDHPKTKTVWDGLKDVLPEKPPERRLTRAAVAKARRAQAANDTEPAETGAPSAVEAAPASTSLDSKYKLTDEKWERAFPSNTLQEEEKSPLITLLIILLGLAIVGASGYFVLHVLQVI
ncbi:MAG: tetratricopeptide repeat protein [bacterium]